MSAYEGRELPTLDELPRVADPLSVAARARRDEMLGSLEARVRARRLRRRAARAAALAASAVAVGALVLLVQPPPHPAAPQRASEQRIAKDSAPAPALAGAGEPPNDAWPPARAPVPRLVSYVSNDPGALARFRAGRTRAQAEVLDDAALLGALREAGLPAGLVRTPGRVTLAFHHAERADRTP